MVFSATVIMLYFVMECGALTMHQVGIFSMCSNESFGNRTKRHLDAEIYNEALEAFSKELWRDALYESYSVHYIYTGISFETYLKKVIHGDIKYVPIDVCDDFVNLTSAVNHLLLDTKYAAIDKRRQINRTTIFAVFTFLPPKMSSFVQTIFSMTKTLVHNFGFIENPKGTFLSPYLRHFGETLLEIVDRFGLEDLFFVSLSDKAHNRELYHEYYNATIPLFVEQKKCLQLREVTPQEISNRKLFNTSMFEGHDDPVIILFGDERQINTSLIGLKDLYESIPGMTIFTHGMQSKLVYVVGRHYPRNYPHSFIDIIDWGRYYNSNFKKLSINSTWSQDVVYKINSLESYIFYDFLDLRFRLYNRMLEIVSLFKSEMVKKKRIHLESYLSMSSSKDKPTLMRIRGNYKNMVTNDLLWNYWRLCSLISLSNWRNRQRLKNRLFACFSRRTHHPRNSQRCSRY